MVWVKTNGLISKVKAQIALFLECASERNNLIYHRMLLKIWPHLTFGWPFVNISLTIHPTHSKLYYLYDPYNLTSNFTYMKGHLKYFEILTPTWPSRDPYWKGAKLSKTLSKCCLTYNDFKTINNSVSLKWHLSTTSTTVFMFWISKFRKTLNYWNLGMFSGFYLRHHVKFLCISCYCTRLKNAQGWILF